MSKELDYIADLEKENRLLGERCIQLLKDKGGLIDRLEDLQEQNSQMFNTIALQEQQIEKMKLFHNKEEMTVIRDTLQSYMNEHKEFDFIIHNVVSRLNNTMIDYFEVTVEEIER